MEFIGRKEELSVLEEQYEMDHSFVIIKGRRRIGKSRLIDEFCRDKNAFIFQADREESYSIINSFCNKLSSKYNLGDTTAKTWESAIDLYLSVSENEKRILVIDEFQYIVRSDKNSENEFQSIWDRKLSKSNVMFIISGSYKTLMEDLTKYDKPLYGRNTCDLLLKPLSFKDCIGDKDYKYAVEEYAFTGGIPYYVILMNRNKKVIENIVNRTLNMGAPLLNEIPYLMSDEFKEISSYNTYLKTIAAGHHKMNSICSALQISSNKVSPYLDRLIGSGIIERRISVLENAPEKNRSGLYLISDKFISFWFKFIYPNKNDISLGNTDYTVNYLKSHYIDSHVAFVFEDICREELKQYLRSIGIYATYGSHWDKNIEIDVVARDDSNKVLYFGECKYHNSPIDLDVIKKLKTKSEKILFKNYELRYCVFSISGYTKTAIDYSKKEKVMLFNCGKLI